MLENRKHPRRCLDALGSIQFAYITIKQVGCVVQDIGEGGAKLQTLSVAGIPSEFDLEVEGVVRACFVRWRRDRMLGVQFIPASMRSL
jgi:hypothetical protein